MATALGEPYQERGSVEFGPFELRGPSFEHKPRTRPRAAGQKEAAASPRYLAVRIIKGPIHDYILKRPFHDARLYRHPRSLQD
jgi:hypothetical protein